MGMDLALPGSPPDLETNKKLPPGSFSFCFGARENKGIGSVRIRLLLYKISLLKGLLKAL